MPCDGLRSKVLWLRSKVEEGKPLPPPSLYFLGHREVLKREREREKKKYVYINILIRNLVDLSGRPFQVLAVSKV